jgi:D-arabinose 1-dehydrogenase-like Zn-dependent alcohol dehydrogenase
MEFVRTNAGIDELIDYTDKEAMHKFVEDNAGQFDCIYDTATGSGKGEDYVSTSIPTLLKKGTGKYVQINGKAFDWMRRFSGTEKEHRTLVLTATNAKSDLEKVAELLQKTNAKPFLNTKDFNEAGINDAFAQLKGRRTKGKIVLNIA